MQQMVIDRKDMERNPIVERLKSSGTAYSPSKLFCKISGLDARQLIRDGIETISNPRLYEIDMENEYKSLAMLHEGLPKNVVRPLLFFKMHDGDKIVSCGYIMEKMDGTTLGSRYLIKDINEDDYDKPTAYVPPKRIMGAFRDCLVRDLGNLVKLVEELHAKGLGHGDLNPSNIMVLRSGGIKLIDPLPYANGNEIDMKETIRLERANTFRAWRNLNMLARAGFNSVKMESECMRK